MRSLIERQGAVATVVPSMREVPLESNPLVFAFAETLLGGRVDVVVFLTGIGARMLLEVAETRFDREALLAALRRVTVAVRGPKPVAVLREWNVPVAIRAAEPNTWHELVSALEAAGAIAGKRIAIQEYGRPSTELYRELSRLGAVVEAVPVYRWILPEDTAPLRTAVRETIEGRFDLLLFTSAHQLDCVLEVAEAAGEKEAWLQAARSCVIASIGPTASEALRDSGLPVDVEARPTRMGHLVRAAIEAAPAILAAKRA
ncbi:MAG TPA: uroporphyrinogen-III synthase [Planctomycetaceae bacterium]|jgi:uroporphyrinogen-III synthase|nr:uroporphyrinogen-III synthase [Planctomycetaceae bacterium]